MQASRLSIFILGAIVVICYPWNGQLSFANGVPKHFSNPPPPEKKPDKPTLKIVGPDPDSEFSYIPSGEGRFRIIATAQVKPAKYKNQVEWELENIGKASITVEPKRGSAVVIVVEKMPEHAKDFGKKFLRAFIPGYPSAKDQISIKVYFPPTQANHPGEGSGETPNWFYYWSQTSAGKGFDPAYNPNLVLCNQPGLAQARYIYSEDRIHMSEAAYSSPCKARTGAGSSTGIDCFGELLRHETVHQKELQYWWPVIHAGVKYGPPGCASLPEVIAKNPVLKYAGIDTDLDMVPDYIEKALAKIRKCQWDNANSCTRRPEKGMPDSEMNAYTEGWKAWTVTSADSEDWSQCGKQWTRIAQCPKKKRW